MFLRYFLLFLFIPVISWAHSWYPADCCSDKDCKPVPCDAIIPQGDGTFIYNGMKFAGKMVRASLDGACHICNAENLLPYCVFFPGQV